MIFQMIKCNNNKIKTIPKTISLKDNRCFGGICKKCDKYTSYFCEHINKYIHCECCDEMKENKKMDKSLIIKVFAEELARLQKQADKYYYEEKDKSMSDFLLVQVIPIKKLAIKLNICKEVYNEAYKIYDFRNSGKTGFIYKGGKLNVNKK